MEHCMAIRADGNKVSDRIDSILVTDRRDWYDVVNVYESLAKGAIALAEIH